MICKNCGMQNNEGSRFCFGCGSPLEIVSQPENQMMMNNQVNTMNQPQMQSVQPQIQNNNPQKEKPKLNKKLLFIIGGSVLGLIIVVVLLILLLGGGDKKSKSVISLFDLEQPIPVYKDGGYVYIDTKGKMPKNIKYNEASDFMGDFAYVELDDGTSALIDKNQNIKVSATSYYAIEYIEETDSWLIDGILYNSKLNAITDANYELEAEDDGYFTYTNKEHTEYGVINENGKVVYKGNSLIYSFETTDYTLDRDYAVIVIEQGTTYKEYLISLDDGTIVYENKFKDPTDSYSNSLNESYDGIFYVYNDSYSRAETIYVKDKKVVYSIKEDIYDLELYGDNYLEIDYGYDYEELGKAQRLYYYDIKNAKLLTEEPELEEEKAPEKEVDIKIRQIVRCDHGYGLIDDKKVIIPCMYDNIDYLPGNVHEYMKQKESKDLMYVEKNDKIFIYDANKRKEYLTFADSDNYEIIDSSYSLLIKQELYIDDPNSWGDKLNKTIVYNLITKQQIEFDSTSEIEIRTNYFTEEKNGKTMYYNMNFEKIYTEA